MATADALPLGLSLSIKNRGGASQLEKSEIPCFEEQARGPNSLLPYDDTGTVVVGSVWLALYFIMVIDQFITPTS